MRNESGCDDVYSTDVTVTVFPDISISAQPVGVQSAKVEL
jgi:hypothetical protein